MTVCGICLGEVAPGADYHSGCLRQLFGIDSLPFVDVELAKLHSLGLAMAGHTSISGVQRKISVSLSTDRMTLQVAIEGGRFILKPPTQTFPALAQNELLSMRLAEAAGVPIPPCGLVPLKDGAIAYVVARFDRTKDGRKLHQEDFCQLAGKSPKEKYDGSAELCVRLLRNYATQPPVELLNLFRLLVVSWWTGNGDLHLKNLSLVRTAEGIYQLSPAYDLVSTRLYVPGDQLALPVGGKRDHLTLRQWLAFAAYAGLADIDARRVLSEIVAACPRAVALVARSALPGDLRETYSSLLQERGAMLART